MPPTDNFDPIYDFANEVKGDRHGGRGGGLIHTRVYSRARVRLFIDVYVHIITRILVCGGWKRAWGQMGCEAGYISRGSVHHGTAGDLLDRQGDNYGLCSRAVTSRVRGGQFENNESLRLYGRNQRKEDLGSSP